MVIKTFNYVYSFTISQTLKEKQKMMKNTIGFFLLAGLLGLSFAKPMPQEAKEMKDETTAMPMPVSIT